MKITRNHSQIQKQVGDLSHKATLVKRMIAACTMCVAAMLFAMGIRATVQASNRYDVSNYKGNKEQSEWTAPKKEGKIFAGWYTSEDYDTPYTEKTGTAYAKFVDEKVLCVKKQLPSGVSTEDSTTNVRFLTSIDTLMFSCVGFEVHVANSGKQFDLVEKTAYSSVLVNGEASPVTSQEVFRTTEAVYFVLHSITGIPNAFFHETFTVNPYWYTMDGTKVYGTSASFTISEAITDQTTLYLDYKTGLGEDLEYDNELYGMNLSNDIEGADPGCIYISEEEDSVWGGYYYMYRSGSTADYGYTLPAELSSQGISHMAFLCCRSKDMYNWELAGALDAGYSLLVETEDWCQESFWAPEVIRNPNDGKYYMYFSANWPKGYGVEGMSDSDNKFDRLTLGVAVSDSPTGPFDVLYETDTATGKRTPTINLHTGCNTAYPWAAIDASPFFDEDGTLYLYFNKHTDDHYSQLNGVWGMKMESMTKPDYNTVVCLAIPGYAAVSSTPGSIESVSKGTAYYDSEGGINEAPGMLKHNGRYYLTYASNGYGANNYSVHQAISTLPLGAFTKLSKEQGNPVLNGADQGYMNGTAHHDIVQNGSELWIIYGRHNSTKGCDDAGWGRGISVDRLNFVKNSDGVDALTANGPSITLQWLPENVSGYQNLAQTSEVTISGGSGAYYLTDGVLPYYTLTRNKVMSAAGDVTITMKWQQPVRVSSVMVYNSYRIENAFSKISSMKFKLADDSSWTDWNYENAVIENLEFPDRYESDGYIPCAPAVAEFAAIRVTELQITVRADDRLQTGSTSLELSEIVVLGGKEGDEFDYEEGYHSFCTIEPDSGICIDGVLDEEMWGNAKWFDSNQLSTVDTTIPPLGFTGIVTDKGIYIAARADDCNIKNDGQLTMRDNSAFHFLLIADNVGERKPNHMLYVKDIYVDMRGDCASAQGANFLRAVKVDGEINSGQTQKAIIEMFIPWEYLQVDTSKGIPKEFRMYPIYRAVLYEASEATDLDYNFANGSQDPDNYCRFGKNGFIDPTVPYEQNPLFVQSVKIGDASLYSALRKWDLSRMKENVVTGLDGNSSQPLYFAQTGAQALLQTKVIRTDDLTDTTTVHEGQPLAGIFVTDGTNPGYLGIRNNGVVYNDIWLNRSVSYDILATWSVAEHLTAQLDIALHNGVFYIYVDGIFVRSLNLSEVLPNAAEDSVLAFGLTMEASGNTAEIQYSDVKFTTEEAKVTEFLGANNSLFKKTVTFSDGTTQITSDYVKWDTSKLAENTLSCSYALGSSWSFMYFANTGKTALIHTVIKRTDALEAGCFDSPKAMLMVNNGSGGGVLGIKGTAVTYGTGTEEWGVLPYAVLANWDTNHLSIVMDIAYKDGKFYLYVDNTFVRTFEIGDLLPGATKDTELAFGFTVDLGAPAQLDYTDIQFTTDAAKVDEFINQ